MELSTQTLDILKNFATINGNLIVEPGSTIATMSPLKTVIGRADVEETFTTPFAIWELPKFLGIVSLFSKPSFDFGDKQVVISSGKQKTKYTYAEASMVEKPKSVKWPSTDVEFDLSAEHLAKTMKALAVLTLTEVAIIGDGKSVSIQAVNSKNPTADSFSIDIAESAAKFTAVLKPENVKVMNNKDYKVKISNKGIMHLEADKLQYWLVLEQHSKFE
jgi:hypothetical protein